MHSVTLALGSGSGSEWLVYFHIVDEVFVPVEWLTNTFVRGHVATFAAGWKVLSSAIAEGG